MVASARAEECLERHNLLVPAVVQVANHMAAEREVSMQRSACNGGIGGQVDDRACACKAVDKHALHICRACGLSFSQCRSACSRSRTAPDN